MDDDGKGGRLSFEIRETDLAGRCGRLMIGDRSMETPALMPVINPNLASAGRSIPPTELRSAFGFEAIITNSYIIRNNSELSDKALRSGLHRFLDFDGVIMTDSGTFQSYIYQNRRGGEVEVDPLEIVRLQRELGSDIGTILDRFTLPGSPRDVASSELEVTMRRAGESQPESGSMELAVPVQGGLHMDLRQLSGSLIRELGVRYAPIGGVVPLMESYRYSDLVDIIVASKMGLGPSIPAHLFGAGHPMILPLAAALGCDLFDSASYAKYAVDGRYMTRYRTHHIGNLDELPCSCPVCSKIDAESLKGAPFEERGDLIARHNLWVLRDTIAEIRISIREGTLWEMIERSAMFRPHLYSAVRRLRVHKDYIEGESPRSARRFMCSTSLSLSRPEFGRYSRCLQKRYQPQSGEETMVLTDWTLSHSRGVETTLREAAANGITVVIRTPLGPVPYEILDMYPLSQSIFPDPGNLDMGLEGWMSERMKLLGKMFPGAVIEWDGKEELESRGSHLLPDLFWLQKVINITRMQFGLYNGKGADRMLFGNWTDLEEMRGRLDLVISKRTGKLRNVYLREGEARNHLLSLRAEDGLFTLKWEGGSRLHAGSGGLWRRVVVEEETGEFNAKGLNVFCKFVLDSDPEIRPGDQVLVVGPDDDLFAIGKAQVSSRVMKEGDAGIAVRVKEGKGKKTGAK